MLSNIRITLRCTSVSPTLRPWREGNTSTVGAVRSVGVTSFVVRSSCGLFGVLVTLVGRFGAHFRRRMCAGAACTRITRHYRVRGLEQVVHPSHQCCMHHVLMSIWAAPGYLTCPVFFDAQRVFACRSRETHTTEVTQGLLQSLVLHSEPPSWFFVLWSAKCRKGSFAAVFARSACARLRSSY